MNTPKEFVIFECGKQFFPTYAQAYFHHKKVFKPIHYVLTLTMSAHRRVSDLDDAYYRYCQNKLGCDFYDFKSKKRIIQQKLLEDIKK